MLLLLLPLFSLVNGGMGISCFTCSSNNGSKPYCEDPIDTSLVKYEEKCVVPKNNHKGLFPANFCIKITGTNVMTYEKLVVRSCAWKSMDSQCGIFKYEDAEMTGCILTCKDNGCNGAESTSYQKNIFILISPLLVTFVVRNIL